MRDIIIFSGSSHPELAQEIANKLGLSMGKCILSKFSNNETSVQVMESVRDMDVYIVQTSCHSQNDVNNPNSGLTLNDHLMEMLIMISACKMASARKVIVVLPSSFYARQPDVPFRKDLSPPMESNLSKTMLKQQLEKTAKKLYQSGQSESDKPREKSPTRLQVTRSLDLGVSKTVISSPIEPSVSSQGLVRSGYRHWVARSGTLFAHMMMAAGTDHIITLDLHDPQVQGFYDIPVDNLYGASLMVKYIRENIVNYQDAVVISPDAGGAKRATTIAHKLGSKFALIHKERKVNRTTGEETMFATTQPPQHAHYDQEFSMMLVGTVKDKVCILIDDIADTSVTITKAAEVLHNNGASRIVALVTHGVLSGDAPYRVRDSHINQIVFSNSVPQDRNLSILGQIPDKRKRRGTTVVVHKDLEDELPLKQQEGKLGIFDVSGLFAEAIRRIHHGESIANFMYGPTIGKVS